MCLFAEFARKLSLVCTLQCSLLFLCYQCLWCCELDKFSSQLTNLPRLTRCLYYITQFTLRYTCTKAIKHTLHILQYTCTIPYIRIMQSHSASVYVFYVRIHWHYYKYITKTKKRNYNYFVSIFLSGVHMHNFVLNTRWRYRS